jgi:phage terminase large subunit-like protein
MNRAAVIQQIAIMEEKLKRSKGDLYLRVFNSLYPWQSDFISATSDYHESCLMAANQIGKSYIGTLIDSIHLTGDYPDGWEGHTFDFAPHCWCLGYSMEKTRDLLQNALFGNYANGEFEGGLVPKDRIESWESATGTPNAMRTVRVSHSSGGISVMQFWSYSQGQHAIMGDVVDWVHIDEEPKDSAIRPQVITRTINGDKGKGGRIIYTFTPENGKTELVIGFMDNPTKDQFFMMKGWSDAPHITKEKADRIMAIYPAHQRDMRSKGIPLMGSGLIFETDMNELKVEPFEIPKHWFVINGMDFGWDHPQAHIQLVWDRDSDIFYLTNGWKKSKKQPFEAWHCVKPWAEDIPTAWPADGLQTEKGSAKEQRSYYSEAGFFMLPSHATWEDGGNGVWAGIGQLNELMNTGRLKVFSNLHEVFDELQQYHTKTTGDGKISIVKLRDDLIDSLRYAYMMRRHAIRICDINQQIHHGLAHHQGRDETTGY